jgi:hypothetical protein
MVSKLRDVDYLLHNIVLTVQYKPQPLDVTYVHQVKYFLVVYVWLHHVVMVCVKDWKNVMVVMCLSDQRAPLVAV